MEMGIENFHTVLYRLHVDFFLFIGPQFLLLAPILALDFPPPLSSFSFFLSLFPVLSAPPSAVLLPPPFLHLVIARFIPASVRLAARV